MNAAGGDPKDRLNAFIRSQSVIGAEKTEYMLLAILMSAEFNGSGDEIEQRLIELMAHGGCPAGNREFRTEKRRFPQGNRR
jgi:hypothetical protein